MPSGRPPAHWLSPFHSSGDRLRRSRGWRESKDSGAAIPGWTGIGQSAFFGGLCQYAALWRKTRPRMRRAWIFWAARGSCRDRVLEGDSIEPRPEPPPERLPRATRRGEHEAGERGDQTGGSRLGRRRSVAVRMLGRFRQARRGARFAGGQDCAHLLGHAFILLGQRFQDQRGLALHSRAPGTRWVPSGSRAKAWALHSSTSPDSTLARSSGVGSHVIWLQKSKVFPI